MSVSSAMRDAKVEVDDRGLVPLPRARAVLAAATVVDRDTLDAVWAALLSLEPEELVPATAHLDWQFPVRGKENLALVERYGEGAIPWLRTRIRHGVLVNHPWCVAPCLLALGTLSSLDVMLEVRGALLAAGDMRFWQFTAAELPGDEAALEADALALVLEWCRLHPAKALACLVKRADSHPRARAALTKLAEASPEDTCAALRAANRGDLVESLALPQKLSREAILRVLDAACSGASGGWPWFSMGVDGRCEYFGLRLVAFRAKRGDGWGIVLERLMGCDPDSFQIARYAYGPLAANGSTFETTHFLDSAFEIESTADDAPLFHGALAKGPAGDLVLDESLFAKHDLRPNQVTEHGGWAARTLALRAYLAEHPRAFWPEPSEAREASGVVDGELFLVSDAFFHASGSPLEGNPAEPWSLAPSATGTYRSLAEALVERDPKRFEPGTSNLDYRLHAYAEDTFVLPWREHRVSTGEGYLRAAMAETGLPLDGRGLLPLATARALLDGTNALSRGAGRREPNGAWVWDLDRTWAALLSLEDAAEAAAHVKRLSFTDPPRDAAKNVALVERYGDAALAVVRAREDAAGVVVADAPVFRATVLGVASAAGFAFVWDISGYREPDNQDSPETQATALFTSWMVLHPEVGYPELAKRVEAGDPAAAAFFTSWATPQVRRVFRWVAAKLGETRALAVIHRVGLSCELLPEQITAVMDAAVAAGKWPVVRTEAGPSRELHALRLLAARARGKADWVVVIERLEGYGRALKIERYTFGETVAPGPNEAHTVALQGLTIPDGLPADPEDTRLVEPPDYWTKIDGAAAQVARFRAFFRAHPAKVWPEPRALLLALGIEDPSIVVESTAFAHVSVVGEGLPSASATYVSLAKALVAEDPSLFTPGEKSFDPRDHIFEPAREEHEEHDHA